MSKIGIEFFQDVFEPTLPIIRLTKSKNKMTGTATFVFVKPKILHLVFDSDQIVKEMSLVWQRKKIKTTDISLFFFKGQPFVIKSIFLFKNSKEWFEFLTFMQYYSQELGLSFSEKNI